VAAAAQQNTAGMKDLGCGSPSGYGVPEAADRIIQLRSLRGNGCGAVSNEVATVNPRITLLQRH